MIILQMSIAEFFKNFSTNLKYKNLVFQHNISIPKAKEKEKINTFDLSLLSIVPWGWDRGTANMQEQLTCRDSHIASNAAA